MSLMSLKESFEPIDRQNRFFNPIGNYKSTFKKNGKIVYIEIKDLQELKIISKRLEKPIFYDIHYYYVIFDDIHYRTRRIDKIHQKYGI